MIVGISRGLRMEMADFELLKTDMYSNNVPFVKEYVQFWSMICVNAVTSHTGTPPAGLPKH